MSWHIAVVSEDVSVMYMAQHRSALENINSEKSYVPPAKKIGKSMNIFLKDCHLGALWLN